MNDEKHMTIGLKGRKTCSYMGLDRFDLNPLDYIIWGALQQTGLLPILNKNRSLVNGGITHQKKEISRSTSSPKCQCTAE